MLLFSPIRFLELKVFQFTHFLGNKPIENINVVKTIGEKKELPFCVSYL